MNTNFALDFFGNEVVFSLETITVGDIMDIETRRTVLSQGRYSALTKAAVMGDKKARYTRDLIDAISLFSVKVADFEKSYLSNLPKNDGLTPFGNIYEIPILQSRAIVRNFLLVRDSYNNYLGELFEVYEGETGDQKKV